ncbi:MAG: LacI family DNA-binding transcriptional regulator [Planctomycetota bacterium]|nr:LacI family DNA-binding transcriptional regulator [Planctomycetota bacterium]
MASVRAIAKKVGVSAATVSRALNHHDNVDPKTRAKVLAAANDAGYAPAVGKRVTTVIGLAYPGEPVRADYGGFDSALLAGILRGLNEQRFDLAILSLQRDKRPDESFTQFFYRKGVRGVILRTFEETRGVCELIAAEAFPSIVVADRFESEPINYIRCSSRDDSRRAVEHLIDLGHRRIALGMHQYPDTDHRDRKQGYLDALHARGLSEEGMIYEFCASSEGGASLITRLMGLPQPPTALFLTDPLASVGALRRCLELGIRVPFEFSIVGFDDSDIRRHTYPSLTAVVQDAAMLGFEAARWLSRRLVGRGEERLRSDRTTMFEINHSTAPPPRELVRVLPDGTRLGLAIGASADTVGHVPAQVASANACAAPAGSHAATPISDLLPVQVRTPRLMPVGLGDSGGSLSSTVGSPSLSGAISSAVSGSESVSGSEMSNASV